MWFSFSAYEAAPLPNQWNAAAVGQAAEEINNQSIKMGPKVASWTVKKLLMSLWLLTYGGSYQRLHLLLPEGGAADGRHSLCFHTASNSPYFAFSCGSTKIFFFLTTRCDINQFEHLLKIIANDTLKPLFSFLIISQIILCCYIHGISVAVHIFIGFTSMTSTVNVFGKLWSGGQTRLMLLTKRRLQYKI